MITPVNLATGLAGTPINESSPIGIIIAPDGKTAYVANYALGTVTPMNLPASTFGPPVKVGNHPVAIAITPDGKTAYVTDNGDGTVTPITLPAVQARPAQSAEPSQSAQHHTPQAPASFPGAVAIPVGTACIWAYPGQASGQTSGSPDSIMCLAPDGKTLGGFTGIHSLDAWCTNPLHTGFKYMSGSRFDYGTGKWVCIP